MLPSKGAATALGLKEKLILATVGVAVLLCFGTTLLKKESIAWVGNKRIIIETVDTPAARELGLSGRQSLASDHGMMFVFDEPSNYCFWMKDMNFPLDIIWLNENKQVVYIANDLSPSTYPNAYCPNDNAKYVLEVNASVATDAGLNRGDSINF